MSIQRFVGDNIGGVNRLLWAYAKDLVDVIVIIPNVGVVNISQETIDEYFNEVFFVTETAIRKEESDKSGHGKYHDQGIEIRLFKDRQDISDVINQIGDRQLVCLVYDNNGLVKLVGTPNEGLLLNDSFETGKQAKDTNAYRVEFVGSTTGKSIIVNIDA